MKILITGATGLVGSELVRLCLAQNISVNYLTTDKKKIVSKENYQGFYWNPMANEIDITCFNEVTAIVNLAGASISKKWTTTYKKTIMQSRVHSLKTLYSGLEKASNTTVKSFVSASAIGIYPNSLTNYYGEQETGVDDSFLGTVVSAWEEEALKFRKLPLKTAVIRIGLVMSLKGGALPEIIKPIKYFVGAAFGNGMHWQSWIHITDLSHMFLYVIEKELSGIYNGVAPNPVTNLKLTKEVARFLKKPLLLPNIPKFVMKIILGEMSYLLFASQRVSSKRIQKKGFVFKYSTFYNALENL